MNDDEDDDQDREDEPVVPQEPRRRAKRSDAGVAKPMMQGKSHQTQWMNKEADLMWGEILQKMENDGRTPHDMKISVSVEEGGNFSKLGEFEGSSVVGTDSFSPSEAITRRVEDSFHIPSRYPGPRKYTIRFLWKNNSQVYGIGFLSVASPQQILALRQQAIAENTDYSPMPQQPNGQPMGVGRPQGQYPQPQYPQWQGPYYPPPPQYGYPQQPDARVAQLEAELARQREENARNTGMLEELIRAQREGRAPNAPPPVAAAPAVGIAGPPQPQQVNIESAIEKAVVAAVSLLGGRGLAGPQQRSVLEDNMTKASNAMLEGMMTTAMKMVSMSMQKSLTGLGAPAEEEEEEPAPIIPPPDPKDGLPFQTIQLEQKWPDGTNICYAKPKEGDSPVNWMGVGFTNPYLVTKFGEGFSRVAESVAEAVKNIGIAGPHIVRQIPEAAVPAGPPAGSGGGGFGSGWGE